MDERLAKMNSVNSRPIQIHPSWQKMAEEGNDREHQ
jgi:hypothetical protein